MENVISKELLSEVLNDRVRIVTLESEILYNFYEDNIEEKIEETKIFYFSKNDLDYKSINIHELIDKCQEWAFKNGMCSIDLQYDEIFYFLVVKMFSGEMYQSLHTAKDDILIGELKAYQWVYEKEKK